MEAAFRRYAALLQAGRTASGRGSIAPDGKALRGSVEPRGIARTARWRSSPDFDKFHDRTAAQMPSALATHGAVRAMRRWCSPGASPAEPSITVAIYASC